MNHSLYRAKVAGKVCQGNTVVMQYNTLQYTHRRYSTINYSLYRAKLLQKFVRVLPQLQLNPGIFPTQGIRKNMAQSRPRIQTGKSTIFQAKNCKIQRFQAPLLPYSPRYHTAVMFADVSEGPHMMPREASGLKLQRLIAKEFLQARGLMTCQFV